MPRDSKTSNYLHIVLGVLLAISDSVIMHWLLVTVPLTLQEKASSD